MKGRRVYDDADDPGLALAPGDYGKDSRNGLWYVRPPGENSMMGSLARHDVVEHDDGTITVSPSILIDYPNTDGGWTWHGYLEKGIWREV